MDREEELEAQLREALRVDVPSELKLSMRERIMNEARASQQARQKATASRRWRLPFSLEIIRLHPIAFAGVFFLSAFAGTAAASSAAGPDSLLYPVRQKLEDTRVTLTRSDSDRARVELGLADERLTEASAMLSEGKPDYVPDLLARYEAKMGQAASLRDKAATAGQDVSEIDAMIAANAARSNEIVAAAAQSGALNGGGPEASVTGFAAVGLQTGNASGNARGSGNSSSADAGRTMAPAPGAAPGDGQNLSPGALDSNGMGAPGIGTGEADLAATDDAAAQNQDERDSGGSSHTNNRRGSDSVHNSASGNQRRHGSSANHGANTQNGNAPVNAHRD